MDGERDAESESECVALLDVAESPLADEAESDAEAQPITLATELRALLTLFAGIFLAMASWVFIKTTDTALIGHVSTQALSSSALADLWMSSTGVLVLGRILGVFVANAVGASNPRLSFVWLQVSLAVLLPGMLVVMALWLATGPILRLLGADEELVPQASYYGMTLALALPGRTVMSQISQFLAGHGMVKPEAYASICASAFNLVFGLVLVLGVPFKNWHGLGFDACPWVTTATETFQLLGMWVVYAHFQKLHVQLGWDGFHFKEVTRARICEFLRMYIPAALSGASDYWRMSVIGLMASSLGADDLAAFNSSYRILWMVLVLVGALAFAMRVRLSLHLGRGDLAAARLAMGIGIVLAFSSLLVISLAVAVYARALGRIFSNDPVILDLFEAARVPLALALLFMNMTVFLEQVPTAMGRTQATLVAGVIGSWAGQVPCCLLVLNYWRRDLYGLYIGVAAGYLLVSVLLAVVILRVDWDEAVKEAQTRSEAVPVADADADADADAEALTEAGSDSYELLQT